MATRARSRLPSRIKNSFSGVLAAACWCAWLQTHAAAQLVSPGECPFVQDVRSFDDGKLVGATLERREPDIDRYGQFYGEGVLLLKGDSFDRLIAGSGFLWSWIFWRDGHEIVADRSPLHFMQVFVLIDIASGKQLAVFSLPDDKGEPPDWVKALQKEQARAAGDSPVPKRDCRFRIPAATSGVR